MTSLIGRKKEKSTLEHLLNSNSAEFLAIWGRRRVGKTFLIEEFFRERTSKTMRVLGVKQNPTAHTPAKSGTQSSSFRVQLRIFREALERTFYGGAPLPAPSNWKDAFEMLGAAIHQESLSRTAESKPLLVFIDELPWLATPRSDLLLALDSAWNSTLKNYPFLRLVVAGSAASWMIKNIVSNKGGLHNRLTAKINLQPFLLGETESYLRAKELNFTRQQILDLYLVFGGIPYYLNHVRTGESHSQAIARICFESGPLRNEYEELYSSLFDEHQTHELVTRVLSKKRKGLTRSEIIEASSLPDGGSFSEKLNELVHSGFVALIPSVFGKDSPRYRLIDPFVLFASKWILPAGKGLLSKGNDPDYFLRQIESQEYAIWRGYSFENICYLHALQVRSALGLRSLECEMGTWEAKKMPSKKENPKRQSKAKEQGESNLKKQSTDVELSKGAQIDLVIDRSDDSISLCEIKHRSAPFEVTEAYASQLEDRKRIFKEVTKTQKNVYTVLITNTGIVRNERSQRCVQGVVELGDLFREV